MSANKPEAEDAQMLELVQVVLVFQSANNTYANKHFSDNLETRYFWALINGYLDYNRTFSREFYEYKEYPSFRVGDSEVVYGFELTSESGLYGVIFRKGNIVQRISIEGIGANLDILKRLAIIASTKID